METDPNNTSKSRIAPKGTRKTQLIEATIEAIATHGLAKTTTSTITEIAGLSLGIVNFHFQSKQNLFHETLLYLATEHHEHWRKAYDDSVMGPKEKLLAIVDAHFTPEICNSQKLSVWFAFFGEIGRRAVYRELVDDIDHERQATSILLIQEILAQDSTPNRLPPEHIAMQLEAMYDGMWLNILLYPETFTLNQARTQLRCFLANAMPQHFDMPPLPKQPATS